LFRELSVLIPNDACREWIHAFTDDQKPGQGDFTFVQLSDTHWGFNDVKINPDYANTLKKAIREVNDLKVKPDFVVFTGDLTHTTDDPKIRRQRMAEFKSIFTADTAGEYDFYCDVFCGEGHSDMTGRIVVE
jgi:predicted MPP superfamily phosphohydrolase